MGNAAVFLSCTNATLPFKCVYSFLAWCFGQMAIGWMDVQSVLTNSFSCMGKLVLYNQLMNK